MTKLARTRVRARKGGQSWSLAMSEYGRAPRVMICTILTLHPVYLHAAHVCRHGVLGSVQIGRTQRRNRADHDSARWPVFRHGQLPALTALASLDTRSRQLGHPRSGSDLYPTVHPAMSAVGRTQRRNRADHNPGRSSVLIHGQGPALTALASPDTRSRQLCHPRSVTGSCLAAKVPNSSHLQNGFYLELRSDQGFYPWFRKPNFHAS